MPLTPKNKFAKKKNYPKNKQNVNVLMWWMVITMFVWLKKVTDVNLDKKIRICHIYKFL